MVTTAHNANQKTWYKQTEVGVIPEDWKIEKLGNCILGTPQYGINAPAVPYEDLLPTYIRITDITEESQFSPENIVSVRHASSDNYVLNPGDLVFARTGASVGKTYLCKPEDGELVFAGYLIRVKVNPTKLLPDYLAAYVKTEYYWNWVRVMSMRSGQPGINGNEYAQLPIPLPSPGEQQAIATALSDVDALITSLDKLITKKRTIKQATMQQLLTGKRRLLSFCEGSGAKKRYKQTSIGIIPTDWKLAKIGEYAFVTKLAGFEYTNYFDYRKSGPIIAIRALNIKDGKLDLTDVHTIPYETSKLLPRSQLAKGDLVISYVGTLGCVAVVPEDARFHLAPNVAKIRTNPNQVDPFYLSQCLNGEIGQQAIFKAAASTTQAALSMHNLREVTFILPSLPEQRAIATVLSDMDAEIVALERRRDKTRALKQGMMQELLTGKTRLT